MQRIIKILLCLLCMGIVLSGCSRFSDVGSQMGGLVGKGDMDDAVEHSIVLDNGEMKQFGEAIGVNVPIIENEKNIGVEYTINQVQCFDTPEEAGINREQMISTEDQIALLEADPTQSIEKQNIDECSILLCDLTIKNINSDLLTITQISLVYQSADTKELQLTSYPAWFSKSISLNPEDSQYYNYKLGENETVDAQIAWVIDLDKYDPENLYLGIQYDGDSPKFVYLNLK